MSRAEDFAALGRSIEAVNGILVGTGDITQKVAKNLETMNQMLAKFGETALQGTPGLPTELSQSVKPGSAAPQSENQRQYNDQVIKQLQTDSDRIKSVFGSDNFIAHEFDLSIGYIKDQRLSGQDAIRRLQAILWNWQGGLFQELGEGGDMGTLAHELLAFINSGSLNF